MNLEQVAEILVPLFGLIFIFGLPTTAWIIFRFLAHRERMEMIRAGIVPPGSGGAGGTVRDRVGSRGAPGSPSPGGEPYTVARAQNQLRKGITLTFIGLALFIGLSFIGYHEDGWRPGPWLLGGLIPMFVGIAQVVSALLFGARLNSAQAWNGPYAQAPIPPGPAGPLPTGAVPPTYDGSYTYRPGDTQELEPPYSPPERRS